MKAPLHKNIIQRCRKVPLDLYIQNEDSKVQDSSPMHLLLTSFRVCSVFLQAVKNCAMFAFLLFFLFVSYIKQKQTTNKQQGGEKEAEKNKRSEKYPKHSILVRK